MSDNEQPLFVIGQRFKEHEGAKFYQTFNLARSSPTLKLIIGQTGKRLQVITPAMAKGMYLQPYRYECSVAALHHNDVAVIRLQTM